MSYVKFVQITPSLLQLVRLSVSVRKVSSDPLQILRQQLALVRNPTLCLFCTSSSFWSHWMYFRRRLWLIYFPVKLLPVPHATSLPPPSQERAACSCHGAHLSRPEGVATSPTAWCVRSATSPSVPPVVRRSVLSPLRQNFRSLKWSLVTWILITTTRSLWRLTVECPSMAQRGPLHPSPLLWIIQVRFMDLHFSLVKILNTFNG